MFVFSDKEKPSHWLQQKHLCAGSEFDRTLLAGPNDEPLYMLKPKAIYVLRWINRKILFPLPHLDYRTVDVRIRIATGMLNKLEGIIPKDVLIAYHMRLTTRVREIRRELWTEDLPF